MIMNFFFLLCTFHFFQAQLQQSSHLKGQKVGDSVMVYGLEYGKEGPKFLEFKQENTIGGLKESVSFLIQDTNEILLFFGIGISKTESEDPSSRRNGGNLIDENSFEEKAYDHVWKYSTTKNQWMFVKGRVEPNQITQGTGGFIRNPKSIEIGSRFGVKGWNNGGSITLFGGAGFFFSMIPQGDSVLSYCNEFWTYDVLNNTFEPIGDKFFQGIPDSFYQSDIAEFPSGRIGHEIIKLNEDEVLLVGGKGFQTKNLTFNTGIKEFKLGDWWIYSISNDIWTIGNIELINTKEANMIYGETNVYHSNNQIGAIFYHSGVLINSEEVMIFGGNGPNDMLSNIVHKYNITSNMWKYVSGNYSLYTYAGEYERSYNASNFPGPRASFKMWKIADDEILLFGGYGFQDTDIPGLLNDEWRFNTTSNFWKYTGTKSSKYINRYIYNDNKEELFGGMQSFSGEFIEDTNDLFIIGGNGFDYFTESLLNDVWKVYLGPMCYYKRGDDTDVCSSHGLCVSYNNCSCFKGYAGDYCQNNEVIEAMVSYLWLFITIPIVIVVTLIIFAVIILFFILLTTKLKTDLQKFNEIEDIELVLEEQKLSKDSTIAHLNINKSLFEIDVKDLKILKKIGQGGSSAVVYLALWNKQQVAFKCFQVNEFMESEKYTEFEKEVEILASVNFPFILSFYGATMNSKRLGFVMEFAENGDLEQFLKSPKGKHYPLKEKLRMLYEISSAMLYLHNNKIIHRDLKLQNILITENEETRLMDFGLSKILGLGTEKTRTRKIGTSFFIAPEVIEGRYGKPCDVYSFTMVMFIVITGDFLPFGKFTLNGEGIVSKLLKDPNFRPDLSKLNEFKVPKQIKEMIKQNWDHSSAKRMNFEEICEILKQYVKKDSDLEENDDNNNKIYKEMEKRIDFLEKQNQSLLQKIEELKSQQLIN